MATMEKTGNSPLVTSLFPKIHFQKNEEELQNTQLFDSCECCKNSEDFQPRQATTFSQKVRHELKIPLSINCPQMIPFSFQPSIDRESPGLLMVNQNVVTHPQVRSEPIQWFLIGFRGPLKLQYVTVASDGSRCLFTTCLIEATYSTIALTTDGGTQPLNFQIYLPVNSIVRWSVTLSPYDIRGWWNR